MRPTLPLVLLVVALPLAYGALDPRGNPPAWQVDGLEGAAAPWIRLADTNGDGALDIVLTDPVVDPTRPELNDPSRLLVFHGAASPALTPDRSFDAGSDVVLSARGSLGDLDGDGDDDFVSWAGNPDVSRTLWVRRGGPGGLSTTAEQLDIDDPYNPTGFTKRVPVGPILDATADGFGDVLVMATGLASRPGQSVFALHLGTATGIEEDAAFTMAFAFEGLVHTEGRLVGDVDADTFREAAFLHLLDVGDDAGLVVNIGLVRGSEEGLRDFTWASSAVSVRVASAADAWLVDTGDVDGDGLADVGVGLRPIKPGEPNQLLVFRGDRNYGFAISDPTVEWSEATKGTSAVIGVGDLDGDGNPDIVAGRPEAPGTDGSGAVDVSFGRLLRVTQRVDATWTASPGEHGFGAAGALGDVDGDGNDDVVVAVRGDPEDATTPRRVVLFRGFRDRDLDGWDDDADCKPMDPAVNPDADEVWYDDIDQDCDGNDRDQDGDAANLDEDCNDTDAAIGPQVEEVWYDGIDQDCDDNDADQDGDGHEALVVGGGDCDDLDPDVNPDAEDVADNGLDEDCVDGDNLSISPTEPGCACSAAPSGLAGAPLPLLLALLVRRRYSSGPRPSSASTTTAVV